MNKKTPTMNSVWLRFILIFVLIAILIANVTTSVNAVSDTNEFVADLNEQKAQLYAAKNAHNAWALAFLTSVTLGTQFTSSLDPNSCDFGLFVNSNAIKTDPNYESFLSSAMTVHSNIHLNGEQILNSTSYTDAQRAEAYQSLIAPNIVSLLSIIDTQIANIDSLIVKANDDLTSTITLMTVMVGLSILSIIAISIATLSFIKRKLVVPVKLISIEAAKLAKGDLNLDMYKGSSLEEIDNLSTALETSGEKLKFIINDLSVGVGTLAKKDFTIMPKMIFPGDFVEIEQNLATLINGIRATMLDIAHASEEVSSAASQVSMTSSSLAQGSTEQSASIDTLTSSVDDITVQIKDNATSANEANTHGKNVQKIMEQSVAQMNELMQSIAEIQSTSAAINNIIKTIDDIAFQTNILALNAAVEAARAGERGKGFAVVADEVRNLAQKSAEAAQSTTELIAKSLDAVNNGIELANSTNSTFDTMKSTVDEVINIVETISDSSAKQNQDMSGISESVYQIATVVQTNTATSEESASTSQELSSQADKLKYLVNEFKVIPPSN